MIFKPKIIGFVCNWSKPSNVEVEGPEGVHGTPKIHVVRIMCAGRIDPVIVLDTFAKGADGVLVIGCPAPDCHYIEGNLHAEHKINVLKKLLPFAGLEPERLRLDCVYAADIEPFAAIVDDFRNQIMQLGQSPLAGKTPDEKVLLSVLAAKNAAADFRLRVLTGREEELTEARNVYGETIPKGEFDELVDQIVEEEFVRHKIHLLTKQKPLSVKELAAAINAKPAAILRQISDMRRRNMITLHHIQKTTPLYKALEAQ